MTREELKVMLDTYAAVKAEADEANKVLNSIKKQLRAALDEMGKDKLVVDDYTMQVVTCTKTGMDTAAFKEACPSIYAIYETKTAYEQFRINQSTKKK